MASTRLDSLGPPLRGDGADELEGVVVDLAGQQGVHKAHLGCGVLGRLCQVPVEHRLRDQHGGHCGQLVGQRGQPGLPQATGDRVEIADDGGERVAAGRAQARRCACLDGRL